MEKLPDEVLERLFRFLAGDERVLLVLGRVCRRWRSLAVSILWRSWVESECGLDAVLSGMWTESAGTRTLEVDDDKVDDGHCRVEHRTVEELFLRWAGLAWHNMRRGIKNQSILPDQLVVDRQWFSLRGRRHIRTISMNDDELLDGEVHLTCFTDIAMGQGGKVYFRANRGWLLSLSLGGSSRKNHNDRDHEDHVEDDLDRCGQPLLEIISRPETTVTRSRSGSDSSGSWNGWIPRIADDAEVDFGLQYEVISSPTSAATESRSDGDGPGSWNSQWLVTNGSTLAWLEVGLAANGGSPLEKTLKLRLLKLPSLMEIEALEIPGDRRDGGARQRRRINKSIRSLAMNRDFVVCLDNWSIHAWRLDDLSCCQQIRDLGGSGWLLDPGYDHQVGLSDKYLVTLLSYNLMGSQRDIGDHDHQAYGRSNYVQVRCLLRPAKGGGGSASIVCPDVQARLGHRDMGSKLMERIVVSPGALSQVGLHLVAIQLMGGLLDQDGRSIQVRTLPQLHLVRSFPVSPCPLSAFLCPISWVGNRLFMQGCVLDRYEEPRMLLSVWDAQDPEDVREILLAEEGDAADLISVGRTHVFRAYRSSSLPPPSPQQRSKEDDGHKSWMKFDYYDFCSGILSNYRLDIS